MGFLNSERFRVLDKVIGRIYDNLIASDNEKAQHLAILCVATLIFLILVMAGRLLTADPPAEGLLLGVGTTLVIYTLSRTRYYHIGISFAVSAGYVGGVLTCISNPNPVGIGLLIAPLLIFTLFFRGQYNLTATGIILATALGIIIFVPGDWQDAWIMLFVLYVCSVMITLVNHSVSRTINALEEANLLYRPLFEQSTDAVLLLDLHGNRIRVNQRTVDLLGEGPGGKIQQMTYRDTVTETEQSNSQAIIARLLRGDEVPIYERTFAPADRPEIFAEINVELVRDQHGQPHHIQSIVRNATERKEIERALRESEERLRKIVDNIPIMISIYDQHGRFLFTNTYWDAVRGWTASELAEQADPLVLFYPDASLRQDVREYMLTASAGWRDFPSHTKQRGVRTISWTNIRLSDGRSMGIGQDVTEARQAEDQRIELAVEKHRWQLLTTFLQNASHEFRTPLATINSALHILNRTDDPTRRERKSQQITAQVNRINHLVDMLMATVCQHLTMRFDDDSQIDLDLPVEPLHVVGSQDYLMTAFEQLIDNAYRFSPEDAPISVRGYAKADQACIEIRDQGPGIPSEFLPRIFETFWRDDTAHTTPGLGLGLPIARRIIERHNGQIVVESEVGKGTTVRVLLPTASHLTKV